MSCSLDYTQWWIDRSHPTPCRLFARVVTLEARTINATCNLTIQNLTKRGKGGIFRLGQYVRRHNVACCVIRYIQPPHLQMS